MTTENDDTFDPPYVKDADDAADTQNQQIGRAHV